MKVDKILVIIDVQNDFVDGPLGSEEAQKIVPNIVNKMKNYEGTSNLVLFTKDTHFENYLNTQEGKLLPIPHCFINSQGWSIHSDISNEFKKGNYYRYSSNSIINSRILKEQFGSISLAEILKELSPKQIEFCGLVTDICVVSNALLTKAFVPDIPVIVDASCCAGTTVEKHKAALETMKSCQIKVVNE